jgi:hypothetical protein
VCLLGRHTTGRAGAHRKRVEATRGLLGSAARLDITARGHTTHGDKHHHNDEPGGWYQDEEHVTGSAQLPPLSSRMASPELFVARIPYPPLTSGTHETQWRRPCHREPAPLSKAQSQVRPVTAFGIAVRAIIAQLPATSAPPGTQQGVPPAKPGGRSGGDTGFRGLSSRTPGMRLDGV